MPRALRNLLVIGASTLVLLISTQSPTPLQAQPACPTRVCNMPFNSCNCCSPLGEHEASCVDNKGPCYWIGGAC